MEKAHAPPVIGIFDSGIGGLTVLSAIAQHLPFADLIYFGDTARLPYGDKSKDTIVRYSLENAQFLSGKNIDFLIVACNTASAYALETLRGHVDIPVIGVIEPGAQKAVQMTHKGRIAVLGTKGTIKSGAYEQAIKSIDPSIHVVSIPCPLLVPLVEEGFLEHQATRLILKEYLYQVHSEDVDTIVLGCTHYPLLRELIAEEVEGHIQIVDSATTCAAQLGVMIGSSSYREPGRQIFYVSDDPHKFRQMGERLLKKSISDVELVVEGQAVLQCL
jgi:glutamate racemase